MPRRSKPFQPDYDQWEPPVELLELIDRSNKKLRQRDRVELIIAFYAAEHGGNSPNFTQIAEIMGTSRGNAYKFGMELTAPWECRAIKKNGEFWLVNSEYTHPVIRNKFSRVLREP